MFLPAADLLCWWTFPITQDFTFSTSTIEYYHKYLHFSVDRTLEFLMRHLSRLATFSPITSMHTKNLAIVWAPNLLRWLSPSTSSAICLYRPVGTAASPCQAFCGSELGHVSVVQRSEIGCGVSGPSRSSRPVLVAQQRSWRCVSSRWWWSSSSTTRRRCSARNSTPS